MKITLMLDLVFTAGFLMLVWLGLKRGFIRMTMSVAALVVALGVAALLTVTATNPIVDRWAGEKTRAFLDGQAEKYFQDEESVDSLLGMYETSMNAVKRVLGVGEATPADLTRAVESGCAEAGITDEATVTAIRRVVSDAFEEAKDQIRKAKDGEPVDVYEIIAEALREAGVTKESTVASIAKRVKALTEESTLASLFAMIAGEEETDDSGETDVMGGLAYMIARLWVGVLVFALGFAVSYAVLRVLINQLDFIDRIPVVGPVNTVLGGLMGAVGGLILLMVPIVAVTKIGGKLFGMEIRADFFAGSRVLGALARFWPGK